MVQLSQFGLAVDLANLGIGVATGAFAGVNAYVAATRWPQRRLWRLTRPSTLKFCVATSAKTDTGKYQRYSTGIGQVRALAFITHSLRAAYPDVNLTGVHLSEEIDPANLQNDLILLGGAKNNDKTARVCEMLFPHTAVRSLADGRIEFDGKLYDAETREGSVRTDYALFMVTDNPFAPTRRVFVIVGCHTYGVAAAARFAIEQLGPRRLFLPKRFAALAEVVVESNADVLIKAKHFKKLRRVP